MKQNAMIILVAVLLAACTNRKVSQTSDSALSIPPAALLPSTAVAEEQTLRFVQKKIKDDPDDFIAQNKLAAWHLQHLRETGDLASLEIAMNAAQASLAALPAEHNTGGLALLAQAEFTAHEFAASRQHAERLVELEPGKGYPFEILGDDLLELGEYDRAETAFRAFELYGGVQDLTRVAIEQRLSRLAFLHGDQQSAAQHMLRALKIALSLVVPPPETVAWCRWQLGELAFNAGNYSVAERHYRDALITVPGYFRAVASLGKVRAAHGDLTEAIAKYEHAIRIIPDPLFVTALGDLYKRVGRNQEAEKQYQLVEAISKLNVYSRQQALFYADHDLKPEEAFSIAMKEYAVRKDIYGADALAWTALKAGRLREAQTAMNEALRLGTQDAKLFYHAGEIAQAAHDFAGALNYFKRVSDLNPEFDPLQAPLLQRGN
jgi:tetratricopeptide (TPR) repeat protein